MVAAKLANMARGDNQHASIEATSQSAAAELLNISRSAVQRATTVQAQGAAELVAAVEKGKVSVSAAADVATMISVMIVI
jgi:DNA-binding transcriptional regulator YdaS (Cro superfamily)